MNRVQKTRIAIKTLIIIFMVLLVFIILNFGIHVRRVILYNAQERSIDGASPSTEVTVNFSASDSWDKENDCPDDIALKGTTHSVDVYNNTSAKLEGWTLKIDIQGDCYINQAWNGTVEIHQRVNGTENVETLTLNNKTTGRTLGSLKYDKAGDIWLIPLSKGDFIIYHPSTEEYEVDANSNTQNIGIIMYSVDGSEDLNRYILEYKLSKSIWSGTEAAIFTVFMPIWLVAMAIFIIVSIMTTKFEKRYNRQKSVTSEFLSVFSNFVDAKDPEMKGHSTRVAEYSSMIAKKLGMKESDCENIYYTGLVHDIGKCYIPDYILQKKGALTNEEFETIKTHTTKGAQMLENCKCIPGIADGVKYHHENYDGTGYPEKLAGEEIPLVGRIIGVADSYDTMCNGNAHHPKFSKEKCAEELKLNKGTRYDPVIVDAFLEALDEKDKETWEIK